MMSGAPQGSVRAGPGTDVFLRSPAGSDGWHGCAATIGPSGWPGWFTA